MTPCPLAERGNIGVMPSPPGGKGRAVGIVGGMDCTVGGGGLAGSGTSWDDTCSVGVEAIGLLAGGSGLEAGLGPTDTKQASEGVSGLLCRAVFLAGAGGMTRQGMSASPVGVSGRLGHFPAGGWELLSSASAWRCCLRRRYSDRLRGRGLASWVVALVPLSTFRGPTTSLTSEMMAFGESKDSDSRRNWGAGLPWADDTAARLGSVGLDLTSTGLTGARSLETESTGAGLAETESTSGKSPEIGTTTARSVAAKSARTGSVSTGSAGRWSTSSVLAEGKSTSARSPGTGSAGTGATAVGPASTESSGMGSARAESTNERELVSMVSPRLGRRSGGPSLAGLACPALLFKFLGLGFSTVAAQARAQARGFPLPRGGPTSL